MIWFLKSGAILAQNLDCPHNGYVKGSKARKGILKVTTTLRDTKIRIPLTAIHLLLFTQKKRKWPKLTIVTRTGISSMGVSILVKKFGPL